MKTSIRTLAFAVALALPMAAGAHKLWLQPSATVLSDTGYVTVDAAVSNDLFYFNHVPLRTDGLVVTAPDGSRVPAENTATLKYRSVFDVPLEQEGTYRIATVHDGLFASWRENGENRRWRGNAQTFATEVPKNAEDLRVSQSVNRVETYVTLGAPSEGIFEPTGRGIELVPQTHPNDLFAGEAATFRFLVDGKPAAGLEITAIPGGTRYRDTQAEMKATADADGKVTLTWPEPGMYWINAVVEDDRPSDTLASQRRLNYVATLEVLPQ